MRASAHVCECERACVRARVCEFDYVCVSIRVKNSNYGLKITSQFATRENSTVPRVMIFSCPRTYLGSLLKGEDLGVLGQMIAETFQQGNVGFGPLRHAAENDDELLDGHGLHQLEDARVHVPLQTLWRISQEEEEVDEGVGIQLEPPQIQLTDRRFFRACLTSKK